MIEEEGRINENESKSRRIRQLLVTSHWLLSAAGCWITLFIGSGRKETKDKNKKA